MPAFDESLLESFRYLKELVQSQERKSKSAYISALRPWKERILLTIYLTGMFFGLLTYVPSMVFAINESQYAIAVLDTAAISLVICAILFRKRLSFAIRSGLAMAILFFIGINVLSKLGPFSGGLMWLFSLAIAAGTFLGLRATIISLLINAATLTVFGYLIQDGYFAWSAHWVAPLEKWIVLSANFILLNTLLSTSICVLSLGLESTIQKEREIGDKLGEERKQLVEMNKQLQIEAEVRRQAEEAYRKSEENYRLLADNANDNIMVLRAPDLKFTYISPSIKNTLGYTPEEFMEMSLKDVLTPDSFELAMKKLGDELTEGVKPGQSASSILELKEKKKDGSIIWAEVALTYIRNGSGNIEGILGVARNITDRKLAEKEKKRLELQLIHAQKMEAVGTMAGGIAHDFNNILQAITGYTQLISNTNDLSPRIAGYADKITAASDRASNLIQGLLTFSRKVEPKLKPVDLNQEIHRTMHILERTIPRMIAIELRLENSLNTVLADTNQIGQILMNLGANARDAMPDGGRLLIETTNVKVNGASPDRPPLPGGDYVKLSVSDTGQGISSETQKHMFDPFFTTKETGRGTGLGLSTVYGIVQSHDGAIFCDSVIGNGTRFDIYLPADQYHTLPVSDEKSDEIVLNENNSTILIVDDEEAILDATGEILTEYGYTVLRAQSGESALEVYKTHEKIDLVILDLSMPGMGGRKALQKLLDIDPAAKVIISSGYSDTSRQVALECGAAGFLGKPYRFKDLQKTIKNALELNCLEA